MVDRFSRKILARDEVDGEEHYLQVLKHPSGLMILRDDQISRVMAPSAALDLCLQLVSALGDEPPAVEGAGRGQLLCRRPHKRSLPSLKRGEL